MCNYMNLVLYNPLITVSWVYLVLPQQFQDLPPQQVRVQKGSSCCCSVERERVAWRWEKRLGPWQRSLWGHLGQMGQGLLCIHGPASWLSTSLLSSPLRYSPPEAQEAVGETLSLAVSGDGMLLSALSPEGSSFLCIFSLLWSSVAANFKERKSVDSTLFVNPLPWLLHAHLLRQFGSSSSKPSLHRCYSGALPHWSLLLRQGGSHTSWYRRSSNKNYMRTLSCGYKKILITSLQYYCYYCRLVPLGLHGVSSQFLFLFNLDFSVCSSSSDSKEGYTEETIKKNN